MTAREIRLFGDPVLKTSCRAVDDFDSAGPLVRDLLDTCDQPGRAGVAANQIGVDLSVFSYKVDGQLGYIINPTISSYSEQTDILEEGCLSVPGLWKTVERSSFVTVTGFQLDGAEVQIEADGLLAQVFQHECDHLDGLLYLDRLDRDQKKAAMSEIRNSDWFN